MRDQFPRVLEGPSQLPQNPDSFWILFQKAWLWSKHFNKHATQRICPYKMCLVPPLDHSTNPVLRRREEHTDLLKVDFSRG